MIAIIITAVLLALYAYLQVRDYRLTEAILAGGGEEVWWPTEVVMQWAGHRWGYVKLASALVVVVCFGVATVQAETAAQMLAVHVALLLLDALYVFVVARNRRELDKQEKRNLEQYSHRRRQEVAIELAEMAQRHRDERYIKARPVTDPATGRLMR